jgi:hypothetical protein
MTPDLKLVDNSAASDLGTVSRLSKTLVELAVRASTTTSMVFLGQLGDTISEAESVLKSARLAQLADQILTSRRPAQSQEIKRQLQTLIGSFPNSSRQDLALYGVALLEDVVAEQPAVSALTNACRHLRRTARFVPTISEVLEALARETRLLEAQLEDL